MAPKQKNKEPHRVPIENEPKQSSKTEKVQERLNLAAQEAARGNFAAAAAYANAAANVQKTGQGGNASLQRVQNAYEQYEGLATRAATPQVINPGTPGPGPSGDSGYQTQGYSSYYVPAPPPAPLLPQFKGLSTSSLAIKQAPIDTIVFNDDLVNMENMTELLYENIAGLELANISREDLINGQEVVYSPIANLSSIYKLFNPNNIIATSSTFETYFSRFSIDLILRGMNEPYIDLNTGNLVIEVDNILEEEEIQVQIASSGTIELVE